MKTCRCQLSLTTNVQLCVERDERSSRRHHASKPRYRPSPDEHGEVLSNPSDDSSDAIVDVSGAMVEVGFSARTNIKKLFPTNIV